MMRVTVPTDSLVLDCQPELLPKERKQFLVFLASPQDADHHSLQVWSSALISYLGQTKKIKNLVILNNNHLYKERERRSQAKLEGNNIEGKNHSGK